MAECYTDRFFRFTQRDMEIQGLFFKLPFMERFYPVYEVEEVPEDPEMLMITLGTASYSGYPPMPSKELFDAGDSCLQKYFVHKSQVIFRICERQGYPS